MMSKRERNLVIATVSVLTLFVMNRSALQPYLNARQTLATRQADLLLAEHEAFRLFRKRQQVNKQWKQMLASGLKDTPSQAESRVLHAIRQWAGQARFDLTAVNLERTESSGELRQVTFHATGTGPMRAVSAFLYSVETSAAPLNIINLQLSSRSPGRDDLSLDLRVSTLFLAQTGGPQREK